MGDLTANLSRSEFRCRGKNCAATGQGNCGTDTVDFALVSALQRTVDYFDRDIPEKVYIIITSGDRCDRHNAALRKLYDDTGGKEGAKTAEESQHVFFRAADFKLFYWPENDRTRQKVFIDPEEIFNFLDQTYRDLIALGLYSNRVHADTRTKAGQRWKG